MVLSRIVIQQLGFGNTESGELINQNAAFSDDYLVIALGVGKDDGGLLRRFLFARSNEINPSKWDFCAVLGQR